MEAAHPSHAVHSHSGQAVQVASQSSISSSSHTQHTRSNSPTVSPEESHRSPCPPSDRVQDHLVPFWMHLVLTTVGADAMGRSKLTGWQVPACNHNGGWCGCISRGKTRVSSIHCTLYSCCLNQKQLRTSCSFIHDLEELETCLCFMQKGKDSHGYTAPIPQSWLLEKEYRIWEQMDAGVRRQRLDEMAAHGLVVSPVWCGV
jgi:hypothetical protein